MKNLLLKYCLVLISLVFTMLFVRCVDTVTNPNDSVNKSSITIQIYSPTPTDTLHMGKNVINYSASDYAGGSGLQSFELFAGTDQVSAKSIQGFWVDEKGNNPIIYLHTDSLEKKLNLDPYNLPSSVSYWITVYNKNNMYKISEIQTNVILDRKPEAPSNLTLTKISSSSYNLFWDDNSSNEDYFEIWRKDGSSGVYQKISTLSKNTISKNEFVFSTNIVYYYKLRAVNIYGNSSFSNEVGTSGSNSDGVPGNLIAQALGATKIQLNWKDNSVGELGFKIQRALASSTSFTQIAIVAANKTEYIDENLTANTNYQYRVSSFTSNSQSGWSNIAYAMTYSKDVPPPTNLEAKFNKSLKAVELHWSDNSNSENGSVVERKTSATDEYSDYAYTSRDITSFVDYSIEFDKVYYYRVRYITDEKFRTEPSNEDTAYVPNLPPNAPSNLKIYEFTPDSLYGLTWTDNSNDETGFQIQRRESETNTIKYIDIDANTTAYNDNIPSSSKTYYYKIRAVKNGLYSDYSNEVSTSGSTGSGLSAPSNVTAEKVQGELAVEIKWKDNSSNELGFIIERSSTDNSTYVEIKRVGPDVTFYKDNGPGIYFGGTFMYRLKAFNGQGESAYSSAAVIYIQP